MSWSETDDKDIQENLIKLQIKQKELQSQLNPINIIINNANQIQTRERPFHKTGGQKIIPKDKWGDDMTDEYRLRVKNEIITKTKELLD